MDELGPRVAASLERLRFAPLRDERHPVPELELAQIEATVGSELPADYRWFLSNYGCSHPKAMAAVLADPAIHGVELSLLFGAEATGGGTSVLWNLQNNADDCDPGEIPIGNEIWGNVTTMRVDTGSISFINREEGRRVDDIATGFTDLLSRMVLATEDNEL